MSQIDYGPVHRGEVKPSGKNGEVLPEDMSSATDKEFYCPACGRRYTYMRECVGRTEAPHPAVELVSTAELRGDPAEHTPAPNTDILAKL